MTTNLERIEIRQNKRTLLPSILVIIAWTIGMTYVIFFTSTFDSNKTIIFIYIFLILSLMYGLYIRIKKFLKNEPILTINNFAIEINENGTPVSFLWLQVIDWIIEVDADNGTHYLTIVTADTKKQINISWLEKRPKEIERLLQKFKRR